MKFKDFLTEATEGFDLEKSKSDIIKMVEKLVDLKDIHKLMVILKKAKKSKVVKSKVVKSKDVKSKGVSEHGFDLTDISAKKWKQIVDTYKLKVSNKKDKQFDWKGKNILIVTKNNPITGKYGTKGKREDEKDYASYIGIKGDKKIVDDIVSFIKKHATEIKDESKGRRDFI